MLRKILAVAALALIAGPAFGQYPNKPVTLIVPFSAGGPTDTVAMLDPATLQFRVFKLPSSGVGIRKAIVDGQGRYWYMGSHNGRLGVIE